MYQGATLSYEEVYIVYQNVFEVLGLESRCSWMKHTSNGVFEALCKRSRWDESGFTIHTNLGGIFWH